MIRHVIVIAILAALLAPAAASAQTQPQPQTPFGPLPPAQPTPAPTPAQPEEPSDDDVGRTTLYVIAGALLISFVAVGVFISRDARRATARSGRATDRRRLREEGPHRHQRQAKAKARARGKAQKVARRRNR
jgi:hypothetical protein